MTPREVKTAEDAYRIVDERGLTHVKVGAFDVDGILRGKYMSRAKFFSALQKGFGFCDVIFGWDVNDQLYDNGKYTGWHTGYPDATARILPGTCREIPGENSLLFLAEFDGRAEEICPRGVLRRVLAQLKDEGFTARCGLEYEFFLFDETPSSAAEKGYRNLKTITPGNFGYSLLRSSVWSEWYEELLTAFEEMRISIEGLHTETGPGVMEAALSPASALDAADQGALFKTFAKVFAQRAGMLATFMAKWSNDVPGQSGHLHVSLQKDDGKSAFYDDSADDNMSDTMRHFLAGQQQMLPQVLAMVAPTVNSFSRLVPGFWAPTAATWGIENRTCALRVIPGGPSSQRIEYRVGAADGNPYLVVAAALASGLYGIRNKLEPTERVTGNAYESQMPDALVFPQTLRDAARNLRQNDDLKAILGAAFCEHFAASREWEEREHRRYIDDWQLRRYFEII